VATRRALLLPRDATNEGSRRLRELLRRHTFAALARRLLCDEGTVRRMAHGRGKPSRLLRCRGAEVYGIPEGAWDDPPSRDVYATEEEPLTTKR